MRELSGILEGLALPVFATDQADRLVYVNQAACRLLRKPPELLLGTRDSVLHRARPSGSELSTEHVLAIDGREHVVSILRAQSGGEEAAALSAWHMEDITGLRDTELACALHAKRLELVLDQLPLMIHAHDASGRYVFWNRECERVLGYPASEAVGNPGFLARLYPDPDYRRQILALHETMQDGDTREVALRVADGSERVIAWTCLRTAPPAPGWTAWEIGVDVTGRRAAEQAKCEAEGRAEALFGSSPLGMHLYRLDLGGVLTLAAANPAAGAILHRDHTRLVGQPLEVAAPELSDAETQERFRRTCTLGSPWKAERFDYSDGHVIRAYELHCFQTEPGYCACVFLDLAEQKRLESRLRHQALHDPLTGMANRALCLERIETAQQRAKRRADYRHAVIYLDLDRFQTVNDTLGHLAGDAVLMEVARRLKASVRELDTVARMGGDEFVVLMEEFDSYKRPIQAIKRFQWALGEPIRVQGHEISVTASYGLAMGEPPAQDAVEALRNANLAMHRAKAMGRNHIKSFTSTILAQTLSVLRLENEMDRALARGEFFLEYQPIVHLSDARRLFGFEALARWRHPERGLIMPGEFIPVAEDSGKVAELGFWALREGAMALAGWRRRHPHLKDLVLSVNLSPAQVPRLDFLPRVREILDESGLPAKNLKLEITETALMQSGPAVLNKLEELRDMGVSFSVDDFGTGYSSLAYLTRLPLDHLKIDLSFVRMLEAGQENLEIVRTIVQLAQSLRLDVVAEGVESQSQQEILQSLGCEYFQGYLFARPMPAEQAEAYLRRFDERLPASPEPGLANLP